MISVAMIWISPCWIQTAHFFASFFHLLSLMRSQRRRFQIEFHISKCGSSHLKRSHFRSFFYIFILIPDTRVAASHQFIRVCVWRKQLFSPQFTATCKTAGLASSNVDAFLWFPPVGKRKTEKLCAWEVTSHGANTWLLVFITYLKKVSLPLFRVITSEKFTEMLTTHIIVKLVTNDNKYMNKSVYSQ